MKKEILRMQNVVAGNYAPYGLTDLSLHMNEGECVNVIGLSGAGKTALFDYLSGNVSLRNGLVIYNGNESKVGECFQGTTEVLCIGENSTLIPGLSIAENIFVISGKRKVRNLVLMRNIRYRARLLLSQYAPMLSPDTLIYELTEVQKRMVELLRAIELEVKLVVIDDVFQGIGQDEMLQVEKLLQTMKEKGISILYESHEMDFLQGFVDKAVILRKGKTLRTLYKNDYDETICNQLLVGNEELLRFERGSVYTDQVILNVENLTGIKYIKDVSFKVRAGEIVGFYDLNNQKNMELMDLLTGTEQIQGGNVYICGKEYNPMNMDDALQSGVGIITKNMKVAELVDTMDVVDNLCLPILKKTSVIRFFRNRKVQQYIKKEYLPRLQINKEYEKKQVYYCNTYEKNKIFLTSLLLLQPKFLVAMEPYGSADMIMKEIFYKFFEEMASQKIPILIASQNMNELKAICDTVYVMNGNSIDEVERYEKKTLFFE